jgi:drug/metabolite transporter (DMT)-like permease
MVPRLSTLSTVEIKQPDPAASRRKSIFLVLACTILGAAAQLLIKNGMDHLVMKPMALLTNLPLIGGYFLYGMNTVMLVLALRDGELSALQPIIAMTYVWVTLLSYTLLKESPNWFKNIGIATIVLGVGVIGRGSKK